MVRHTFSVQWIDTSHTKQVRCALLCTIFVLVIISLFQRGNRVHANKNGWWVVDFEFKKQRKETIEGGKQSKKKKKKKKERKTGRPFFLFSTRFQNQDRPIYFSSQNIFFMIPLCILIFKKDFKKTKTKKTLRD